MPRIYASGFNAHNQLDSKTTQDTKAFRPISTARHDDDDDGDAGNEVTVLFACWSTTVLLTRSRMTGLGHQSFDIELTETEVADGCIAGAFGDEDGMRGCFDGVGRLFLLTYDDTADGSWRLVLQPVADPSMRVRHCAVAGNGRVAVVVEHTEALTMEAHRMLGFGCLRNFLTWYSDPSASSLAMEWSSGGGVERPEQLVAGIGTFLLLSSVGEVSTWGDSRYKALGRPMTGSGVVKADMPGIVEALSGLTIKKIASGGWLNAALSSDEALYIWGAESPGSTESIRCLREADAGEVVLVEIPDERGEPLDIKDIAVGDGHIVVIAADNRIFAIGDDRNGQLGIDGDAAFFEDWTEVFIPQKAMAVHCGPKSTFVTAQQ